ncbi:hypothetical protein BBP40_003678 [Aspergillus hancockii]|nr:hypothetical protein BBP40_003678 [Aspergillus hancockii]
MRRAAPWVDGEARVEEIDSEEECLLRDGRGLYVRQLAGMDIDGSSRWRRRMPKYDEFSEDESIDEVDYDLHDDGDSTMAYAVHLAMKDEELLVEDALERIRHAQISGQKNVRLSKRELDALERKRVQTGDKRDSEPRKLTLTTKSSRSRESSTPGAQRRGSSFAQSGQTAPYQLADGSWARSQPRRPQQSDSSSSLSPRSSIRYSERYTVPQQASLRGTAFTPTLPDDSNRVSPDQRPHSKFQPSYVSQPPADPLRGSSRRLLSYLSGYQAGPSRLSSARNSFVPRSKSGAGGSQYNDGGKEGGPDDSGQLHIVDVAERKMPASHASRTATDKGGRRRRSRR